MTVTTDEFTALTRVLDQRWTCRQFRGQPVERDTVRALLRLAQRTPSWCNTQPWQVVVTEGAGTDRFRKELLEHIATATPAPDFAFPAQYTGVYRTAGGNAASNCMKASASAKAITRRPCGKPCGTSNSSTRRTWRS